MKIKQKDKVCTISGATSGMGKAIAESFSDEGAQLVLSGRNMKRGKSLSKALLNSIFVAGDVADAAYNEIFVQSTLENFWQLGIISINAGMLGLKNVAEPPEILWEKTLNLNLSAIFHLCKYAIPHIQKSEAGAIVINSSIAAFKSFPDHPAYCASKTATVALMKQIVVEHATNISINAICAGTVDTPFLWDPAKAFSNPDSAVDGVKNATLMNRFRTPIDIVKPTLFLASEDTSWITATTMTIDDRILNYYMKSKLSIVKIGGN